MGGTGETGGSTGTASRAVARAVIHVPHASVHVPADVRASFLLSDAELERELLAMTDRYTDALFALPAESATSVVYGVSRLVVDPERFVDDDREAMAGVGMGVIYTRTSDGRALRAPPTPDERTALLARFYEPHHARLARAVDAALAAHGACLLVDGHSFPSLRLPYESPDRGRRPGICIGTDEVHTPEWLRAAAVAAFEREGFDVAVNEPFAGAISPARHASDRRVRSLMVEVNRGLYMDESCGAWLAGAAGLRRRLRSALDALLAAAAAPRPSDA
jgi:N-formylglutamate amidohydrolase